MLQNLDHIQKPKNLALALRALKEGKGETAVLAGGTSLTLSGRGNLTALVDLSLCGLAEIKASAQTLRIGSMVTLADLASSAEVASVASGMISQAAREAGNPMTRNLATVGGNVCQVFPWCHLPVVFLALDADFSLAGTEKKSITAADFFFAAPRRIMGDRGVLKEVAVKSSRSLKGAFLRFARTRTDRALLTVAVSFRMNRGVMTDVRAVAGACAPLPQRLGIAEQSLEGKKPSRELFESLSKAPLDGLEIAPDRRASSAYKGELVKVLMERAFLGAWGKPA